MDVTDQRTSTPTPYHEVNEIVAQVLAGVQPALGDAFVAMYLGGSLATGSFNPHTSDIDFVVVTVGGVTDSLATSLRSAHERITEGRTEWAKKLEGLYVPRATLTTRHQSTQRCAYLGVGGRFTTRPYQSDWIIQLHLVQEQGVVVAGPHPKTLIESISPAELQAAGEAIMRDWEPLLEDPQKFDAEYQSYTVLTMCRMLYTLEHGTIVSKAAAARWGKERYGERWGALIDSALAWRHGEPFDHLEAVLRLLRYTIAQSKPVAHPRC